MCKRFDKYLDDTQKMSIGLRGLFQTEDFSDVDALETDIGYRTRWTPAYGKSRLAKLFLLEEYLRKTPPSHTTMITYTGEHDSPKWRRKHGIGYLEWIQQLRIAREKSRKIIWKYAGHMPYLDIWEAHPTSGFAHIHSNYFGEIDETLADRITYHYTNLGIGSKLKGIKIDCRSPQDFSDIKSFIGYQMAYIGGSLIDTINEWTVQDLIFNASVWATRPLLRTFQPSRDLSRVMAPIKGYDARYIHVETFLKQKGIEEELILNKSEYHAVNKPAWSKLRGEIET